MKKLIFLLLLISVLVSSCYPRYDPLFMRQRIKHWWLDQEYERRIREKERAQEDSTGEDEQDSPQPESDPWSDESTET